MRLSIGRKDTIARAGTGIRVWGTCWSIWEYCVVCTTGQGGRQRRIESRHQYSLDNSCVAFVVFSMRVGGSSIGCWIICDRFRGRWGDGSPYLLLADRPEDWDFGSTFPRPGVIVTVFVECSKYELRPELAIAPWPRSSRMQLLGVQSRRWIREPGVTRKRKAKRPTNCKRDFMIVPLLHYEQLNS
jgi:hypothetical protein